MDRMLQTLQAQLEALRTQQREAEREACDRQIEAKVIATVASGLEMLMHDADTPSISLFQEVLEELPVALVVLDIPTRHLLLGNKSARAFLDCDLSCDVVPGWLAAEVSRFLQDSSSPAQSTEVCIELQGVSTPLSVDLQRLAVTATPCLVVVMQDISRHHQVEQALRISEARYRTLVENQNDLMVKIDREGLIEFASPSFSRFVGLSEADLVNIPLFPLIAGERHLQILERLQDAMSHQQPCYEEFGPQGDNNAQKWFGWSIKVVNDRDGKADGFICIGHDITEQKQAEQNILELAYYDNLTGLPNRTLLQDRLLHAISQTRRSELKTGVLFLDLDRFKTVNDTMGHSVGDELLKQVAQRLKDSIRDADTVARQGGDEFVVVLNGIQYGRQVAAVAAKIITALAQPFQVGGQSLQSGVSVGISLFPDDGQDVNTLLKNADMAMYQAKESGRGKFKFFSRELNRRMRERASLEAALRQAIERNELTLHYQPQFNVREQRLTSLEAFVRWHHPEQGLLLPERFIPLAEETGLIVPLGEWVIKTACMQAAGWQAMGGRPIPVSVNLSTRQFRHPDLLELIIRSLVAAGLPSNCLELEVTEDTLLDNPEESSATLHELRWQGVQLAIDDFGTGYSSLSHLRRFPINRLKIDRSFIHNLHTCHDDADIAGAIISVGQSLKLQVVAEGVEQADQLQFLHERGCEEMQGNFFSSPVSASELSQASWFHA